MPLVALIAVFIVVPLAELYVILRVGDAIGVGWTILLLVADSLLGSLLLRSQGRSVWRRFNATLNEGRMPHREVIDGVLVVFGGAFLLTPGFITDIVGLLLLIPPTRALIRPLVMRRLGKRVEVGVAGATRRRPPPGGSGFDVEGTATDYEVPARDIEARSGGLGRPRRERHR